MKALVASPDALAALEMPVGLEERFAEVRKEIEQASAPKPVAAPRPPAAPKQEEAEAAAPAARPVEQPRLSVARPPRPPAERRMVWSEPKIVEVVAAPTPPPAAPKTVSQSIKVDFLELLEDNKARLADEEEDFERIGDVSDDDLDPSYRDPSYREPDPLLTLEGEPGAVLLGVEAGPLDCPWGNPLRIGLPKPDRPLTKPRGVIVTMEQTREMMRRGRL
ncbi:hypothetical protein IHQ68_04505 [Chelatococcus sambhunathii]|uniref:Uncharacterized protein n=1 Tax=Chelatococcus sambhunathii TaxID=363953 RepID=A0ABU1DCR4_9HYPH|nr:hypothetical protein [Chelatococcus sambhunathii]MDR4305887.1 hypothetical protein [Chelatococcus sambhunathii]